MELEAAVAMEEVHESCVLRPGSGGGTPPPENILGKLELISQEFYLIQNHGIVKSEIWRNWWK